MMQDIILAISDDGLTTRTFKATAEKNGLVILETRDRNKRTFESVLSMSSTRLPSSATKVATKLQHICTETVNSVEAVNAQNLVKIEAIISDDTSTAQRLELANLLIALAEQVKPNVSNLDPVHV